MKARRPGRHVVWFPRVAHSLTLPVLARARLSAQVLGEQTWTQARHRN